MAITWAVLSQPGMTIIEVLGSRGAAAPIARASGSRGANFGLDPIAQIGERGKGVEPSRHDFGGAAKTRDSGDVLGAGAAPALLAAAMDQPPGRVRIAQNQRARRPAGRRACGAETV